MTLGEYRHSRFSEELTKQDDYAPETLFLEKLDNVIQSRVGVQVESTKAMGAIAATDMRKVFLDMGQIRGVVGGSDYPRFLSMLKGFNYHEVGHIIYTTQGRAALKALTSPERDSFNILEDQRMECMFVHRYPNSAHYFRGLLVDYLLKHNPTQPGADSMQNTAYALVYGRRFILGDSGVLSSLRATMRKHYSEEVVCTVEHIISEYMSTTDNEKQITLSKMLAALITPPQRQTQEPSMSGAPKAAKKQDKEDAEEIKEQQKTQPKPQDNPQDKPEDNTQDKPEDNPEEDEPGEDEPGEDEGGDGLTQQLTDLQEKVEEQVRPEIEQQIKQMGKSGFEQTENESRQIFTAEPKHRLASQRLQHQLRKIRNDLGNRTTYAQRAGRLDLRAAIHNQDKTALNDFKRYRPDQLSKTRLAVSLMVDASGSMSDSSYDRALGAAWVVSDALEKVGSTARVYEFSSWMRVVKQFSTPHNKGQWGRKHMGGGTDVIYPLKDVLETMKQSIASTRTDNQVVIIFTDGYFGSMGECVKVMQELRTKHGAHVVVMRVDAKESYTRFSDDPTADLKAASDAVITLNSFSKVQESMTALVASIQARAVRRAKGQSISTTTRAKTAVAGVSV